MKKAISISVILILFGSVLTVSCHKDEYKGLDCSTISSAYNANIKPLISANCNSSSACHGAGSSNTDFTTYAGLKSRADDGTLNSRVLEDKNMPPAGALSLDDRKKIKCWLNNGAPNN